MLLPGPRSLSRRLAGLARSHLTTLLNVYPPFVGAGIRVRELGPYGYESSMVLRPWNRNYFGTHFGGSLYAMCDPFFALIVARRLGAGYVVWDKGATIRFRRPGVGTVTARFEISPERIAEIRGEADRLGRLEPTFVALVRGPGGETVAEVEKLVYVRSNAASPPR